jgi:hypothetical protein
MCSTRRTQDRFAAWCRKPAVAVAAAEGAGAAEGAEAVGVAGAAAAAVAADAACLGDLAGFASADCFANKLTHTGRHDMSSWPGSTRSTRPMLVSFAYSLQRCARACVGGPAYEGCADFRPFRKIRARARNEGIRVVEQYALHRRTRVVDRVRVLAS